MYENFRIDFSRPAVLIQGTTFVPDADGLLVLHSNKMSSYTINGIVGDKNMTLLTDYSNGYWCGFFVRAGTSIYSGETSTNYCPRFHYVLPITVPMNPANIITLPDLDLGTVADGWSDGVIRVTNVTTRDIMTGAGSRSIRSSVTVTPLVDNVRGHSCSDGAVSYYVEDLHGYVYGSYNFGSWSPNVQYTKLSYKQQTDPVKSYMEAGAMVKNQNYTFTFSYSYSFPYTHTFRDPQTGQRYGGGVSSSYQRSVGESDFDVLYRIYQDSDQRGYFTGAGSPLIRAETTVQKYGFSPSCRLKVMYIPS